MKRLISHWMMAAMAAALTMTTTACDDDDEEEEARTITISDFATQYLGTQYTVVSVMGAEIPVETDSVVAIVEELCGDMISLTLKDFTAQGTNYGDIVADSVVVTSLTAAEAVFAGSGECVMTKGSREFTATISGLEGSYTAATNVLEVQFDMTLPVSDAMTIGFAITYTSTAE